VEEMKQLGPIENRLEASLKFDAINGDSYERSVVASQIREAILEIRKLRKEIIKEATDESYPRDWRKERKMDDAYSSIPETCAHIGMVAKYLGIIEHQLLVRECEHDFSKKHPPESDIFDIYTPKLKGTTYGSDKYKRYLTEMKPALDHHYANNRHHPEHHENGINDMNLIDLVEMFCDWMAATKRHADGDIIKSIEINGERFGISEQLKSILRNTVEVLEDTNPHIVSSQHDYREWRHKNSDFHPNE